MKLQSVEFNVWFGVGVVALLLACLLIWCTRRALTRVQQDLGAPQRRTGSAASAELTGPVAP